MKLNIENLTYAYKVYEWDLMRTIYFFETIKDGKRYFAKFVKYDHGKTYFLYRTSDPGKDKNYLVEEDIEEFYQDCVKQLEQKKLSTNL
jgi:hypothetical protein